MDVKVYELLVKTANRLDELELFEEAESIDKYLKSMAGIKEDNDPLSKMVSLANALDCSGDEQLQKYASVLDEIMLTIGAPRGSNYEFESKADAEIAKLREKYREEGREEVYKERRKELDEQNGKEATTKAYADQVKKYKPLEASLSTRYCPDHPGGLLIRVGDHVYQCEMDKKMYNYQTGFTTNKGNVIPGGGVEFQTKDWGNRDLGHAMFDTRQTVMSRFASLNLDSDEGRFAAACDYTTSPEILDELSNDSNIGVRGQVAINLNTSLETLEKLSKDSVDAVRALAERVLYEIYPSKEYFNNEWLPRMRKRDAKFANSPSLDDEGYWKLYENKCLKNKQKRFAGEKVYDLGEWLYGPDGDVSDANDLPPFTYGFHMLDGRKVILVSAKVKLNDKQRARIKNEIQGLLGSEPYEIVFEQDIL